MTKNRSNGSQISSGIRENVLQSVEQPYIVKYSMCERTYVGFVHNKNHLRSREITREI